MSIKGNQMKKSNVSVYDAEELAAHILGITEQYEESDDPSYFIEEKFLDAFDTPLSSFHEIVECLLPLVTVAQSELTKTVYRGFTDGQQWLVKEAVE